MDILKASSKLTLWQGDSLELMKRLPDSSVDMILSDPPYGFLDCKWDVSIDWSTFWKEAYRVCKLNAAILLFASSKFTIELAMSNFKDFRYKFIWDKSDGIKSGFLNAHKIPLRAYEEVLVFYRKLPTYNYKDCMIYGFHNYNRKGGESIGNKIYSKYKVKLQVGTDYGARFPLDIVKFNKGNIGRDLHSSYKPISLLEYFVKMYSNAGETILDPFMGCSTVGCACINQGRNYIGMEKDPKIYQTAVNHVSEHFHEPMLAGNDELNSLVIA